MTKYIFLFIFIFYLSHFGEISQPKETADKKILKHRFIYFSKHLSLFSTIFFGENFRSFINSSVNSFSFSIILEKIRQFSNLINCITKNS